MSEPSKYSALLQNAATTGNGQAVDLNGEARNLVFYVEAVGTISTGAVTLEEASTSAYTGTWSALTTAITPVSATSLAYHISGAFGAVRARISTNVTGDGGSVSVRLVAN